jgi:hypothetical protein
VRYNRILLLMLANVLWMSCANIMSPTGGDPDTKPPLLVSRSMKDSALQVKGGKIEFEFDEFIQIKEIQQRMIVSPLMKSKPIVGLRKKKLSILIDDTLLEKNTTYQFNINNAIQDLHEGNPLTDFSFSFSTGNHLDSLNMNVQVIDAQTGLPDTNVMVYLYDAVLSDTIIKTQKPSYVQTSSNGNCTFKHLPAKAFRLFALQDANQNLIYDVASEKIAFFNQPINSTDSNTNIVLHTFRQEAYNDSMPIRGNSNVNRNEKITKLGYNTNIDTAKKNAKNFDLNDSILIFLSGKIAKYDVTKIRLYQNEILDATLNVSLDSSAKKIILKTEWQADANYTLQLNQGFASDSQGLKADSAKLSFKTKRSSDYGFVTLITEKNENHWFELLQNEKIIGRQNAIDTVIIFQRLHAGNYQLRKLNDENKNGKWDAGNLTKKKMPELVNHYPQEITVKANWENKINLNDLEKKTNKAK